jgi:hypothetical protein
LFLPLVDAPRTREERVQEKIRFRIARDDLHKAVFLLGRQT